MANIGMDTLMTHSSLVFWFTLTMMVHTFLDSHIPERGKDVKMSLDLHSKVTVKDFLDLEVTFGDVVLIKVSYRVKRGRKDYTIWALPRDLRGCGIFPLRHEHLEKYGNVYSADSRLVYTGSNLFCKKVVKLANDDHDNGKNL